MTVGYEAVRALLAKYEEMKRLRDEHVRGDSPHPRPRLRALATRFPGALREIDELPMEVIEQRMRGLHAVLEASSEIPQWVALQVGYHAFMRAALRIKRLAHGRDASCAHEVLAELAVSYRPEPEDPPLARFDLVAITEILEPPGGRLNPWVFAKVAEVAGVTPEIVRQALFVR